MTGTSAVLPKGGAVNGFIDEDVELSFAAAKPAPMEVPAAAEATPATATISARPSEVLIKTNN